LGGIASGAVLILALLGMGMIGINSAALFLLLIGAMAILLEIKYGHGELAVGGAIITLFAILLMYQREYFIWSLNYRSMLLGGAVLLLTTIGVVGFYLQKIREVLMRKEKMHEITLLIGKTGIVRRHISPSKPGVVLVASDLWTATADEEIPANAKVRVISVDGLVLKVERVE
jgi:membrane-bound ClpP family serine protease